VTVLRSALIAASQNEWLRRQATQRAFVRQAVSRFVPGETVDAALGAGAKLEQRGLGSILTCLGENVSQRSEAEAVAQHYVGVAERVHAAGLDAEISVKPTQLGLDFDEGLTRGCLETVAGRGEKYGHRVWIDMESSAYVDRTLDLYRRLRPAHPNLGLAMQTYLYRTPQDLESLLPLGPIVRLVKGAYNEPASIAYPRKRDVDEAYFKLATRLLEPDAVRQGAWLTAGTHDQALIARIQQLALARGIARDAFEFAMLYGIHGAEQLRLARDGWRTRVLISYGSHWFPFYMRRLAERPANLLFMMRTLFAR